MHLSENGDADIGAGQKKILSGSLNSGTSRILSYIVKHTPVRLIHFLEVVINVGRSYRRT